MPAARRPFLTVLLGSLAALVGMTASAAAETRICPTCYGRGDIIDRKGNIRTCPTCGGSGVVGR